MPFERTLLALAALALFVTLGSAIFVLLAKLPLHDARPWTALVLGWQYPAQPRVQSLILQSHAISAALLLLLAACLWQRRAPSLHGDARWATARDLTKANPSLLAQRGIFLGRFNRRYLIQGGQSFVLVVAETRGGKGVSVVIPNCLNWTDSLVVMDIKLENFKITSGYRAACGQAVFLFSPAPEDGRTHRWNPLDYVSRNEHKRITDVQRIATLLIGESKDPMWSSDARELFTGLTLMIMDNPHLPFTLGEVYRQLRPEKGFGPYLTDLLDNKDAAVCRNTTARMILAKYATMPEKQRNGVLSSLSPILNLFASSFLDAATSDSDFDFRTLRQRKQTLYIGVTPGDLETYQPIIRLLFQQLVDQNTRTLPDPASDPHQVLLLMDEFAALGKMTALSHAVSFIAGYNLRLLAIIQSESQLRDLYQQGADTIKGNMATRVYFAAKNHRMASDIAAELGDTTTTSQSRSRDHGWSRKLGSKTDSVTKRSLLLPQEIKTIGADSMLLISDNCPPVLAKKAVYYQIDAFLRRCVLKSKRRQARKTTTQAEFLECVRPTPEIPLLTVTPHVMRGLNDAVDTDPASILPEGGQPLTEEQVEAAACSMFAALMIAA